jgi:hypothetical protein
MKTVGVHIPDEYLTASGKPDLRRKEVRELLGKPPIKRKRRKILSPKKKVKAEVAEVAEVAQVTPPEVTDLTQVRKSIEDINQKVEQAGDEVLKKIGQFMGQFESRMGSIENAQVFLLNAFGEYLEECTPMSGYPAYSSTQDVPTPSDYLCNEDDLE